MSAVTNLFLLVPLLLSAQEPTIRIQLIDNGDFREAPTPPDDRTPPKLPWWAVDGAPPKVVERGGEKWLVLEEQAVAGQTVALYAPLAGELVVSARSSDGAKLSLVDAAGRRAEKTVTRGRVGDVEFRGQLFESALVPPVRIELHEGEWSKVEASVALPLPSPADLRAEIVSVLAWIFDTWRERAADVQGRKTAFVSARFDAVTGERIEAIPGGMFPVQQCLAEVLEFHDDSAWRAALELYLRDYLELGLHEETGLPRRWDTVQDVPLDGTYVQIGTDLSFLIGIAQRGPEAWRERARAAAVKMGETILAHGVLPDGNVAAEYRPSDADISTNVPQLRRLDVPCQLARLGALLGDERYLRAARNAVAELEYTHFWSGTWSEIDPGFDDDFGIYGARAVEMLRACPEEAAFRGLLESGWRKYAPLWRDSTRFGGTVAADQVRCWALLADYARLRPEIASELGPLVRAAARAHWKGEQYAGGAWGDVTFFGFEPKTGLQVGDLPGTPANLLNGLAVAHEEVLGLRRDEIRAMYTAVLRSTLAAYRRPYGCITTQRDHQGANPAGGELRLLPGLVRMLRQLSTGR